MAKKYRVKPPVNVGDSYKQKCTHCRGSGSEPGLEDLTCRECHGRGRQKWRIDECADCGGNGRSKKTWGLTKCKRCKGQGWTKRNVG